MDRHAIVGAAVALADRGDAVTMAAVARRLGPYTAMALYRHVPSKEALIDLMLDHVAGEIELPAARGEDWRADLGAIAATSWRMVMRHPWYAEQVHTRPPLGPNAMRRTERMLEVLTGAGAALHEAMTYVAVLDLHIFGSALQAAQDLALRRRYGLATTGDVTAAIIERRALAAPYPLLASWMAEPVTTTADEQFELSLAFLIDGIASRLG